MNERNRVSCAVIPMSLLTDREIRPSAKLLYGVIDYYQTMSGGVCYATNGELAAVMCDCKPDTITRLVAELRSAGYIETTYDVGYGREIRTVK